MTPFYRLIILIILFSRLVLSPCTCHPTTLGRNHTNNMQCIDTERDALLRFKRGITYGAGTTLASWEFHEDCCQWKGIVCSNSSGHIVSLNLAALQGKVSPSLGELKHLKHLILSYSEFTGHIPPQLGNLSKLTTLDLGYSFYDDFDDVQSLSWISRLSLLRYLDLSGAKFSEATNWMTIVNNFRSLSVLRMESCRLPPKISSSLSYHNSSTTLHTISLRDNNLNENSIFQWLFNLSRITNNRLEYLDLSDNAFQLHLPNELGSLHTLSYLSFSNNKFHGSVFKIISKLCNLKHLDLGYNNFTDELTNVVDSLVSCNNKVLVTLGLSGNSIWGTIPNSISSLSSLRELYLNSNQLKGEINLAIGQLVLLENLDLSYNQFEDIITQTLFLNLVNLRELDLSDNLRLVVNIDENWIPPFQLRDIGLSSCKLGPHFPKWLLLQTNFSSFDVSNTSISDTIPVSFWKSLSRNLAYLNMSYNQFYGMIPNLEVVSSIMTIDLSYNLFEGVVPPWFATANNLYLNDNRFSKCSILCPPTKMGTSLVELDLSDNLFSGELPNCWVYFFQLSTLHLENNQFSGRIPNFGSSLTSVHLYNNSYSGPFPTAFVNYTSLVMLNLGHNLFTGHIPSWIGNAFQILSVLILRENHFTGEIPESVCQLNNLQILDLAYNHISGTIPNCIGNFTAMETNASLITFKEYTSLDDGRDEDRMVSRETEFVSWKREVQRFKETIRFVKFMDLSSNELRGKIPDVISSLNQLQSLDLSKNKLSGNIPLEIGNLTALEFLDLSDNNLKGNIPTSLAKVTTLGNLDVSNNNLSGRIPEGSQFQTFDASSYAGNRGLCGAPLPSCSKDRVSSNDPNGDDNTSVEDKNDDNFGFFLGLYISVALGFITGFWVVFGTLLIKTSWRHAYFRFLNNIKDRVF